MILKRVLPWQLTGIKPTCRMKRGIRNDKKKALGQGRYGKIEKDGKDGHVRKGMYENCNSIG